MVLFAVWLTAIALETWLLVHMLWRRLVHRYPYFFAYLTLVWANSFSTWVAYYQQVGAYPWIYWIGELVTVFAGFLIVGEIYRQVFHSFSAIRQIGTWILLFSALAILGIHALLAVTSDLRLDHLFLQLERWIRLTQAGLLAAIVGAAQYYGLRLGRNISGLLIGYGLFVSLTVVNFVFQALGLLDFVQLDRLYVFTYLLTLGIWGWALWSYAPTPALMPATNVAQECAHLNAQLASALTEIRGSVQKALGR